jgi:pseudaminic acid synthase
MFPDFKKGEARRALIVAELSANHNQQFELAVEAIHAAKRAGADAIKLQTFTPDTITIDCDNEYFRDILKGTIWEGKNFYDLYKTTYTPWEWHEELFQIAKKEGLICFSTPFDKTAVDFLEQFNPPAYKIASFEIRDIPLIEYAASKGKTMILSTGIATLEDIELAVQTCRDAGNNDIILLKCTSSYPAPIEDANLLTIPDMKQRFCVEAGLSDHTLGIVAPIVAVTLGAIMVEKHLIPDRSVITPDSSFSLDEKEFAEMVKAIREAEQALGQVDYNQTSSPIEAAKFGRSLFVVKEIKKGEPFTGENVRSIRPAAGMSPASFKKIKGTLASRDYHRGEPLIL